MVGDPLNYLREILRIMVDRALEAKQLSKIAQTGSGTRQQVFEEGRALAYYEVLSTMLGQAAIFGLTKDMLPELDFDPDKELLS